MLVAPVMEVGMGEDSVHPPAHGAELGHRRLLDGNSTRKVFIAIEEASGAVQSVAGVVDRWALLSYQNCHHQTTSLLFIILFPSEIYLSAFS